MTEKPVDLTALADRVKQLREAEDSLFLTIAARKAAERELIEATWKHHGWTEFRELELLPGEVAKLCGVGAVTAWVGKTPTDDWVVLGSSADAVGNKCFVVSGYLGPDNYTDDNGPVLELHEFETVEQAEEFRQKFDEEYSNNPEASDRVFRVILGTEIH